MGPRSVSTPLKTCSRWATCLPLLSTQWQQTQRLGQATRSFTASCIFRSGHNRWSKIRHDKGVADARKSKERTKLSYEVFLASKYGGGPDPTFNTRLANAIVNAKRGALDKTAIETAIARGQGKTASGVALEDVTVEAMLPHGVAAVMEFQTDSKARVLQDVRSIIKRAGGTVTPTSFLFEKKGRVWFEGKDGLGVDDVLDEAIEAGAVDVDVGEGGGLVVDCDPKEVTMLGERLAQKFGLGIEKSEILYDPKEESIVELGEEQSGELEVVVSAIEEDPGLQNIYMNISS